MRNVFYKGGDKPYDVVAESLNRFTDHKMDEYMNPIYGLVYCETGYISNIFFLNQIKLTINNIPQNHIKIISKACAQEGETTVIRPTKNIRDHQVTLKDIGNYIAIKYVNMIAEKAANDAENTTNSAKSSDENTMYIAKLSGNIYVSHEKYHKANQKQLKAIKACISKFSRYIPLTDNDIFAFHMILFCLWWKVDNNTGFNEYYEGIQEVFDIVNQCFPEVEPLKINSTPSTKSSTITSTSTTFEQIVLGITQIDFKLYNQEYSSVFCNETKDIRYPDCGETTVRNIINILCYNKYSQTFDTQLLIDKNAIPELLEYYTVFNTFESQSKKTYSEIYGQELDARNAWSNLIFNKSQYNVIFHTYCKDGYGYNIKSGLAKDGSKVNILQMIQNLLPAVKTWGDFINKNIGSIDVKIDNKGIGEIIITPNFIIDKNFKFYLSCGHFHLDLPKVGKTINYDHLYLGQQDFLDILYKKNITEKNYLEINISPENLIETFHKSVNNELKIGLFELSLTNKYNDNIRRQIYINTEDASFFDMFAEKFGNNPKINKYSFIVKNNFDFVIRLPCLKILNISKDMFDKKIQTIDLTPLEQIEEIGDDFLYRCSELTEVDFSSLSNVHKIGKNFLLDCIKLTKIDLSSFTQLSEIADYFMNNCASLHTINFNEKSNITSVGNSFMHSCKNLSMIDLQCFKNIELINNVFLGTCTSLKTIIFPREFINLTQIGTNFLSNCDKIENVDLSSFTQLYKIGENFLYKCINLVDLIFNTHTNIISVGDGFLKNCSKLEKINLASFKNIDKISEYFMYKCTSLKDVTFPDTFVKVRKIGHYFMSETTNLKTIDLSCFSNVSEISNSFLSTSGIENINLSNMKNVESIGEYFIYNCKNIQTIDLSSLTNLNKIGNNFMRNCKALTNIILPSNLDITNKNFESIKKIVDQINEKNDNITARSTTLGGAGSIQNRYKRITKKNRRQTRRPTRKYK